jgi:hypothetical protein
METHRERELSEIIASYLNTIQLPDNFTSDEVAGKYCLSYVNLLNKHMKNNNIMIEVDNTGLSASSNAPVEIQSPFYRTTLMIAPFEVTKADGSMHPLVLDATSVSQYRELLSQGYKKVAFVSLSRDMEVPECFYDSSTFNSNPMKTKIIDALDEDTEYFETIDVSTISSCVMRRIPSESSWWSTFSSTATYEDLIKLFEVGSRVYDAARTWTVEERKKAVTATCYSTLCKCYAVIKYGRRVFKASFEGKVKWDKLKAHEYRTPLQQQYAGKSWYEIAEEEYKELRESIEAVL